MAVKIFCNSCQKFIKNAKKNDLNILTGSEICQECEETVKTAFEEVEKAARRGIVQIEKKRDTIKANLERMVKKVIKPDDEPN